MSPGLKSKVTAFGPVSKAVTRPLPLIQYAHSSAFGCQCISRSAPGRCVTSPTAIVLETVKLLLSATLTSPPFVFLTGAVDSREKVNGDGGKPPGMIIEHFGTGGKHLMFADLNRPVRQSHSRRR